MSATITGRKRLRVTAVQMKFASSIAGNLATIERMVKEAAQRRADAVLFPECATTGYAYDFAALRLADMISGICFPNPAEGPRIRLLEVLLLGEPGPAPLDDLRALDHDPLCGRGGKGDRTARLARDGRVHEEEMTGTPQSSSAHIAESSDYGRIIFARINLDSRVVHIDYNADRVRRLKERSLAAEHWPPAKGSHRQRNTLTVGTSIVLVKRSAVVCSRQAHPLYGPTRRYRLD